MLRLRDVFGRWESGELSQLEAAELLGMHERTFRRWARRFESDGEGGLEDRRLGRRSGRAVALSVADEVEQPYRERYLGFTAKHFHEYLKATHGYSLGYTWTKVLLQSRGLISAAVGTDLEDLVQTAGRSWLRLHEKGGKVHEMPVHHRLLEHLDAYIAVLDSAEPKSPLFRGALGRTGKLGAHRLSRHDAYAMVRRRAIKAGVVEKIGNQSFRGTGITTYLKNDGTLELAQEMANHASPRTTKLYDRRGDKITQDAVERIRIK